MKKSTMLSFKPLVKALLCTALISFTGCSLPAKTTPTHTSMALPLLSVQHWDGFNREQINQLIQRNGKQSPHYDAQHPPYIVTDFDNTAIFLDIEEATLIYQLENLRFKVTPLQLQQIISKNIKIDSFVPKYNNQKGQPVNIEKISADIIQSYHWLYSNYQGLGGQLSLEKVKQSPHYQNFITKMRYLYAAISDTFDHDVAYPWVTYLFTGFKKNEVRQMTIKTFLWQQKQKIGPITWTSPASLSGQAGIVSVTWDNGLRPYKEMQNLFQVLQQNGIQVYVCSASFVDVVKEMVSNPLVGFLIPESHVYAMQLEHDSQGKIKPEFRHGYFQTQGKGKTLTIQQSLIRQYGYGPLLIAGDSEGDQNMMQDFKDTEKVLIINRLRKAETDIGRFSHLAVQTYGQANTKYLLQGRDANTGLFLSTNKSRAYGQDTLRHLANQ